MFKLFKNLRPREIIMAVICAVLVVGQVYFDLELPDYMTELTTLINTSGTTEAIVEVGFKMLACTVISAMLAIICGFLSSRTASGFSYTVREKLFYHVIDMGKAEMQAFSVPSLITRTTNDITQIQMIISMGLQMLIKAPIMAIWGIVKILGKSWELSIVTAGFVVALCCIVLLVVTTCLPRFRKVQKMTDRINRIARENLTGINVVHAFNAEDYQNEKFDKASKDMYELQLKNQRLFALISPTMTLGMSGLTLAIYWVGAVLVNNIALSNPAGRISMFSEILAFGTYATYIVMSFMMLIIIFMMVPQAQVSAERINEVLNKEFSINDGTVTDTEECGSVEFRNVSFSYPDSPENELENVTFKVNKSETLAIIGATGSGKSTLINLIPRLYDATEGEVLVDGVNVRDYKLSALYDKLGFMTQKATLFSGTIEDNVFLGESSADKNNEVLQKALEVSQSAEFVDKLDDGVEYRIAQLGRNVSGGQKQRLSIARGLARDPEILIFDDSFSALDYRTDALLREKLATEYKDTTKIIVAQRIGTIRNADTIIVLDKGTVVGMGKHTELMQNCSVYREIASSQLSAEELE